MKKIIFASALFLFFAVSYSQTFGASALDVKGTFSNTTPVYNTWLRMSNTQNAIIKFEQTPEGLNNAMQLVQQMLFKNNLEMDRPYFYHSVKSAAIKDNDPKALHNSIRMENQK